MMAIERPSTVVVLAMSADGKIADEVRSPARFGSATDRVHLEKQIAIADGVLFGNRTLHAYGTTLRVTSPELLQLRQQQGKPPQPVQIVGSRSGQIDPTLRFFQQPVPRWLLTVDSAVGSESIHPAGFDRILRAGKETIDWVKAFQQLTTLGIKRLAVLGGGELVASLFAADLIDEIWLTVCPIILGGIAAPTPVAGRGFLAELAPKLQLLEVQQIEQEVFLHYQILRNVPLPS